MKYKLIISDFDGTLAGRDEIISQRVRDAIKRWISSGKGFSIATGKNYLRIKKNIEQLGLKTPQIVMVGAEIVSPGGKKLITHYMDEDTISDFINFVDQHGYGILVDADDYYYTNEKAKYTFNNPYIISLPLSEFKPRPIAKIFVRIDDRPLAEVEKFLNEQLHLRYPDLHFIRAHGPSGGSWDVTSMKGTKHLAALELMKMLGLKPEEVVGVGDGYNDFPLLEACGFKVAMENAPEDLKAIADLVVSSYQEDGVAVLIEKLLKDSSPRSE